MPTKFARTEKGQSLVELASFFMILLLLLVGVVDLGSMFYTYTALRDASQEGVIYGATNPTDIPGIIQRIKYSATFPVQTANIDNITVSCDGITPCAADIHSCQGRQIKVDMTYTYNMITPLIGRTITLTASVSETILQTSKATKDALGATLCTDP